MTGPGPLLPALGGATKGRTPLVGVDGAGVGSIPAVLSDAIRSDPPLADAAAEVGGIPAADEGRS